MEGKKGTHWLSVQFFYVCFSDLLKVIFMYRTIVTCFFFFCCCSKIPPVYLLYRFILIEQNCFLQFGILEFWNLKQTNKKNRIMSIIKEEIFDEQQTTLLSSSSSSTHLYNSNQVSVWMNFLFFVFFCMVKKIRMSFNYVFFFFFFVFYSNLYSRIKIRNFLRINILQIMVAILIIINHH